MKDSPEVELDAIETVKKALCQSNPFSAVDVSGGKEQFAAASVFNILIPLRDSSALVYNTFSQAFARLDADDLEIYRHLESGSIGVSDPSIRDLARGGFAIAKGVDEVGALKRHFDQVRFRPDAAVMTIAPTLACNFGCAYCFQGQHKPIQKMGEKVIAAFKRYGAAEFPALKTLSIVWYGGEPLMAKEVIWELSDFILNICKKHRIGYGSMIVTNGYFLDVPTATRLLESGVTSAQITIDGPASSHDKRRHLTSGKPTFDRIIRNIEQVIEKTKLRITIRINVDEQNVDSAFELLEFLADNGFSLEKNVSVYFAPVEAMTDDCKDCASTTLTKNSYSQLELKLKDRAFELGLLSMHNKIPKFMSNCQAIRPNGLLVCPNGDLHKCWDAVSHPELRVGSLLRDSTDSELRTKQKWDVWSPFDSDVCTSCKLLPTCTGGCAFKTVHSDQTHGETATLPCPSWKSNMAETLFQRAVKMKMIGADLWDDNLSPTWIGGHSKVGGRHDADSVRRFADSVERRLGPIPVRKAEHLAPREQNAPSADRHILINTIN